MNRVMKHTYTLVGCILLGTHVYSLEASFSSSIESVRELLKKEDFRKATSMLHAILVNQDITNPTDFFTLGTLFTESGDPISALEMFKQTEKLIPGNTSVLYNIAYVLKILGNIDASIEIYKKIITTDPSHQSAHLGLALTYLQKGDFKRGWQEHEFNLQRQQKYAPELRHLLQTNSLEGKKILLTPEGGLGDSLQFVRYAKRLKDKGAHITVAVQKALIPLFSLCPYINNVTAHDAITQTFDAHSTLMSLPAAFYDTPENFAIDIPYLQASPELVEKWHFKIATNRNLKIGICWQCNVQNDISRIPIARRGIPLETLAPLMKNPDISWYSLQKEEGLEQLELVKDTLKITSFENFDEEHGAFMDSAALIEAMDLVITIDSAIAHLAGALGKDVWLLLPYSTDWRWIAEASKSPWYPTMTIFKQNNPFDWNSVIAKVASELDHFNDLHCAKTVAINTEVSIGEFLDKISILEIKNKRIRDKNKLKNVRTELATLYQIKAEYITQNSAIDLLEQSLLDINTKLWDIEDKIRDKEYAQEFDDTFIELARSVYITNDERMAIKQKLNQVCGSRLVEEKSYYNYLRSK